MDIGKPAATGGADLTGVLAQKPDPGKTGEAPGARSDQKPGGAAAGRLGPAAVLELSPEARERLELQEALQVAREQYERLPAVRADAVARARERLASGYYDSNEVKAALTERLVALFRRWPAAS